MDDDADAAEVRATLEAAEYIVIELEAFLCDRESKFTRLQNKRLPAFYPHRPHQVLNRASVADINVWVPAMFENAEFRAQAEIDRTAAELIQREIRRDTDLTQFHVAADVDVGQDHRQERAKMNRYPNTAERYNGAAGILLLCCLCLVVSVVL